MTVTNEAALIKNVDGSPAAAMRMPATAGPTTFPMSWETLLSMTALVSCAVPNHLAGEGLPRRFLERVDDAAEQGQAHDHRVR